ncbi:MAG: hypothetical protein JXA14_26665 [Anaerolineae bacterium]|nr:hypothetical protein [Anaerolineae bacterium]
MAKKVIEAIVRLEVEGDEDIIQYFEHALLGWCNDVQVAVFWQEHHPLTRGIEDDDFCSRYGAFSVNSAEVVKVVSS